MESATGILFSHQRTHIRNITTAIARKKFAATVSPQNTINKIKQTYKNSFALINGDDNTTKSRVLEAMAESLSGLKNLKQTYAGDNTITSQIDVMIEDITSKLNVNEEVF